MLTQLKRYHQVCLSLIHHVCERRGTSAIVTGVAIGIAGWSAMHPFVASFGFTREVISGLTLAVACCLAAGLRFSRSRIGSASREHAGLAAVASLVFLPTTLPLASRIVAAFTAERLALDVVQMFALMAAGSVTLGVSAFCAGWIADRHISSGNTKHLLAGASLGICLIAFVLAPLVGLFVPMLAVAILVALSWLKSLVRGVSPIVAERRDERIDLSWLDSFRLVSTAALLAIGACLAGRISAQLMPEAAYLVAAGVATFLAGGAAGSLLAARLGRRGWKQPSLRLTATIIAAVGMLTPLAMFPWLIDRHLSAVAYVSSVPLLMAIRAATVAAFVLPLGCCAGMLFGRRTSNYGTVLFVLAFALGLSGGGWLITAFGVVPLAIVTGFGVVVVNFGPLQLQWSSNGRQWRAAAACGVVFCIAVANAGRYEPQRSARLLFDTETFISCQQGVPRVLLPYLDDTRFLSSFETPGGTVTLWKKNGTAFSTRIDGIPVAMISSRTEICPMPSGDLMRVVLPLVLHDAPGSILLLGDPAGVASRVAAGFPVREIVCYENDDVIKALGANTAGAIGPVSDERLTSIDLEPRLGLTAETRVFDVIVSDPGAPAVLPSTPYFTKEFYTDAKTRLSSEGIFCQRLRAADFGPGPLRVVTNTMRRVFSEVMLLEIGSGEYALLGGTSGKGLIRKGLAERLQRPHVRRALASLGWDWCVPLNLRAIEQEGIATFAGDARGINDVANGRFAYALPIEMMRWGPKSQETAQATAPVSGRLLEGSVPLDEQQDVATRIAQVTGQRALMTRYPDQPWAYRKEVRAQLKESPRSVIQKVNAEIRRVMHPEDRRRLDYFEALGKAIGDVNPKTLAKLESFAEPYDPMITYFLRHEIAPLYAELGDAGAPRELVNRLHTAHYADPRDRSVRNVLAAVDLLVRNPQVVSDPMERFDHMNGLIEVLLRRWENRGAAEPRSAEIMMVDIEKTLDTTEAAINSMDELASSAGVGDTEWRLRKDAIERTLTRPLRKYRTTLLPHLRSAKKKVAAATETE